MQTEPRFSSVGPIGLAVVPKIAWTSAAVTRVQGFGPLPELLVLEAAVPVGPVGVAVVPVG